MTASRRFLVGSTGPEEIHTGQTFAPGEVAVGIDPEDTEDARKIAEGRFIEVTETAKHWASAEAEAKAKELEVDLEQVEATGKNSGATVADVERTHDNQEASK
jgi:pyruvate/2-oxoglutarate dehydrogenase complex dihydrolipoamide acyltransferase (E2) component